MQSKMPLRREKPTFSPHIPPVVRGDDAADVPLEAVKAVERIQGTLHHAKTTAKKAEKSKL